LTQGPFGANSVFVDADPLNCSGDNCICGRKRVPWISFAGIPRHHRLKLRPTYGSQLAFLSHAMLPTVAFVFPNPNHDMHNGKPARIIPAADA
jgi:hypothetical protein